MKKPVNEPLWHVWLMLAAILLLIGVVMLTHSGGINP
jgi:hypothetical protein